MQCAMPAFGLLSPISPRQFLSNQSFPCGILIGSSFRSRSTMARLESCSGHAVSKDICVTISFSRVERPPGLLSSATTASSDTFPSLQTTLSLCKTVGVFCVAVYFHALVMGPLWVFCTIDRCQPGISTDIAYEGSHRPRGWKD